MTVYAEEDMDGLLTSKIEKYNCGIKMIWDLTICLLLTHR